MPTLQKEIEYIPYPDTGYFSAIICDYLAREPSLERFYGNYPDLEGLGRQIGLKKKAYPGKHREILTTVLESQYKGLNTGKALTENLKKLSRDGTYTVVTGHQLNLFTGPLYFLYKIADTINLCRALKQEYPDMDFVPVYWMATEDHDFEEINFFNFHGMKLHWNRPAGGAVGRMDTDGLQAVQEAFAGELGKSENAERLLKLFAEAYLGNKTLTAATRHLVHSLFGEYGLVILDGDDKSLKELMVPIAKGDILDQIIHKEVSDTIAAWEKSGKPYKVQVNPREINFFYLKEGLRERIIERDGRFYVNETEISFTKKELLKELEDHPERFSPNVLARPLYQESVLPNLCYIGGGGELAYWLQMKSTYDAMNIPFPVLLLRNSALLISEKQRNKVQKLDLEIRDLFMKRNAFINKKIRQISNIDIDLSPQRKFLQEQFKALYEIARETDPTFLGAVKAQEVKQLKGLDKLEKRLLKAQKRKLKDQVVRMTDIQNELFPNENLQERVVNFSEAYLERGENLIPELLASLDPLKQEFSILRY